MLCRFIYYDSLQKILFFKIALIKHAHKVNYCRILKKYSTNKASHLVEEGQKTVSVCTIHQIKFC